MGGSGGGTIPEQRVCATVPGETMFSLLLNLHRSAGWFQSLYSSTTAALFKKAAELQDAARRKSLEASHKYYEANAAADYDDYVRSRSQWDYFYSNPLDTGSTTG